MSRNEDGLTAQLQAFAERWLQRPLAEEEVRELDGFGRSLAMRRGATRPHTQAAQAVREGRQRAQAAIEGVLHSAQQAAQQVANAREQEDRAILEMVESADSLAELRPSALPSAQAGDAGAATIFVAQIADRLAHLIRAEVRACFERQFGPDSRRMQAAPDTAGDASQHSTGVSNP